MENDERLYRALSWWYSGGREIYRKHHRVAFLLSPAVPDDPREREKRYCLRVFISCLFGGACVFGARSLIKILDIASAGAAKDAMVLSDRFSFTLLTLALAIMSVLAFRSAFRFFRAWLSLNRAAERLRDSDLHDPERKRFLIRAAGNERGK